MLLLPSYSFNTNEYKLQKYHVLKQKHNLLIVCMPPVKIKTMTICSLTLPYFLRRVTYPKDKACSSPLLSGKSPHGDSESNHFVQHNTLD